VIDYVIKLLKVFDVLIDKIKGEEQKLSAHKRWILWWVVAVILLPIINGICGLFDPDTTSGIMMLPLFLVCIVEIIALVTLPIASLIYLFINARRKMDGMRIL